MLGIRTAKDVIELGVNVITKVVIDPGQTRTGMEGSRVEQSRKRIKASNELMKDN